MKTLITEQLTRLKIADGVATVLAYVIIVSGIVIISWLSNLITKKIIMHYVTKFVEKTSNTMDDILLKNKVFYNLAHVTPGVVIYFSAFLLGSATAFVQKLAMSFIIFIIAYSILKILDSFVEFYRTKDISKGRPIKGIIQVIKIIVVVFTVLFVIVNIMGNSTAWAIFSGIGGMSAILLLIFKDSILGLVAGIQLSTDGLLKIGDWLEMPKYHADGEVIDISLTKITVQNWDKTYTTVPAYKFLEDSFKNWEGMSEAGARRIKRAINIDINTIGFLKQEELNELRKISLLKPYIDEKHKEIDVFNKDIMSEDKIGKRALTNIGTFRAYINLYLKNHPKIHKTYTLLVRQLAPTEQGLPIEIYCFTNDTAWGNYEAIQADIFDHLFAIAPEFGLRIYQQASGYDFTGLMNNDR